MRAAIYSRVSKDKTGRARSVAEQDDANREACLEHGWEATEASYVDNDVSASRFTTRERKSWQRLLQDLEQKKFDVLVLWEPSRGGRELEAWASLLNLCRKNGVQIHVTSHDTTYDLSNPRDWKTLAEDGIDSAYESEKISKRNLRTARETARKGRPHGRLTYGYKRIYDEHGVTSQLPDEETSLIVKEIAERIVNNESTYSIAKDLNSRGVPSPRGGAWEMWALTKIIRNPAYIGKRKYKNELFDAIWPPILDEATYYRCLEILSRPGRRTQRGSENKWLLSGILIAPCGGTVRARMNNGYHAYTCINDFCFGIKTTLVDDFVTQRIITKMSQPETWNSVLSAATEQDQERASAYREIEAKKDELEQWVQAAASGEVSVASFARIEKGLTDRIAELENRLHREINPLLLEMAGPNAGDVWEKWTLGQRREAIRSLYRIHVLPNPGRKKFSGERLRFEPI